jgi:catechol 2,3-dioxygenase-like lactoylglutathione lyase family enzyme
MALDFQVTFDARDPHAANRFWSEALGYEREDHGGLVDQLVHDGLLPADAVVQEEGHSAFRDLAASRDPDGVRPRVLFQRVPEPKNVKNRVHLDLHVGPEQADAEVARLEQLGATVAWVTDDRGAHTVTMRDPEGNEFCVE